MKMRTVALTILCLTLAGIPASGQNWSYDNGPINGTTDAWTINFGFLVSDSFVAQGSNVAGFSFSVWEFSGDVMNSVDWSINSEENSGTLYGSGTAQKGGGAGGTLTDTFISSENAGTLYGSGTAKKGGGAGGTLTDTFISSNQYGYDIDRITVTGLNVNGMTTGNRYWLTLQNAVVPSGNPVFWDENSG